MGYLLENPNRPLVNMGGCRHFSYKIFVRIDKQLGCLLGFEDLAKARTRCVEVHNLFNEDFHI